MVLNANKLPWIKKYSPKSSTEIIGQNSAIEKIKSFIDLPINNKALFLFGPSGTGKTSAVHAISKELDLELVELNASDSRNKNSIESLLKDAVSQQSLFFKSKIILIDEVDGVSGKKDRGAITALKKIVSSTKFPIIFTANDVYIDKLKDLRKISIVTEFVPINHNDVYEHLKNLCSKENIKYDDSSLKQLSRSCNGDLRAAINDLQTYTSKNVFHPSSMEFLSQREQKESVAQALFKIYKTKKPEISLSSFDNVNMNPNDIFNWISYNTPREYTKINDLAKAMDCISLADVFRGRIRRWQYWRFLVYYFQLLTIGVSLSKEKKYASAIEYKRTSIGLKIWQMNMKFAKKKSIAQKLAENTHMSKKLAFDQVNYLKFMINGSSKQDIISQLDLDDAEIKWLEG